MYFTDTKLKFGVLVADSFFITFTPSTTDHTQVDITISQECYFQGLTKMAVTVINVVTDRLLLLLLAHKREKKKMSL